MLVELECRMVIRHDKTSSYLMVLSVGGIIGLADLTTDPLMYCLYYCLWWKLIATHFTLEGVSVWFGLHNLEHFVCQENYIAIHLNSKLCVSQMDFPQNWFASVIVCLLIRLLFWRMQLFVFCKMYLFHFIWRFSLC